MRAASLYDRKAECGTEANAAKFLGAEAGYEACEAAVMTQVFRARQKLKAMLEGEPREAELYGLP